MGQQNQKPQPPPQPSPPHPSLPHPSPTLPSPPPPSPPPTKEQLMQGMKQQQRQMAKRLFQRADEDIQGSSNCSYLSMLGKVNQSQIYKQFTIFQQDSQILLKNAQFFFGVSLGLNEIVIQIFYEKNYSFSQLQNAMKETVEEKDGLYEYFKRSQINIQKFKKQFQTNDEIARGCCLAITYYTGFFKETVDRCCNIIFTLNKSFDKRQFNIKNLLQNNVAGAKICISYWLLRAISYLPIHIGQVTRCIDLSQQQQEQYKIGNMVTWLQFSSCSEGKHIHQTYQKRNTRITIFSISGRKIQEYSNFKQLQKQVLFKPFTHFLVLKRQKIKDKLHVHMRELAVGRNSYNILWVDDQIFQSNWKYKKIIEKVLNKNHKITFIPKSSTQCAIAFMKSQIGKNRRKADFRIVTNFTRPKQQDKYKAGVIFLKELQQMKIISLKMLMIAPNPKDVEEEMRKLIVRQYLLKISDQLQDIQQFVSFQ